MAASEIIPITLVIHLLQTKHKYCNAVLPLIIFSSLYNIYGFEYN